jgi:S-formylglutathione hydrolase FrmB
MIVIEQFDGREISRNVWGDSSVRDLVVYLPPSYERNTGRRYPVAYLLHGYGNRALFWTVPHLNFAVDRRPMGGVLDEVFASNDVPEMIVVMPDGWSKLGCSQWADSSVNGNFERYVAKEIVGHIDATYRTLASRESRGVIGFSSGGIGAWNIGSRNASVFGALAALSADSYFEYTHKAQIYRFFNAILPGRPSGPVNGDQMSWYVYGLASCYSPNPAKPPFYGDIPIDDRSGEIDEAAWAKWLGFDPVVNWESRQNELRSLRGIYLSVGYRDGLDFHWGHRLLAHRLARAGIRHISEEDSGIHSDRLYERVQRAIRWMASVLLSDG